MVPAWGLLSPEVHVVVFFEGVILSLAHFQRRRNVLLGKEAFGLHLLVCRACQRAILAPPLFHTFGIAHLCVCRVVIQEIRDVIKLLFLNKIKITKVYIINEV